jgi:hypothetical protein
MPHPRRPFACIFAALAACGLARILSPAPAHAQPALPVVPALLPNLINYYTFDNPQDGNPLAAVELDLGADATNINLLNGAPRVADGAWRGSTYSLETAQRNTGPNDDWKAGVFFTSSAASTLDGTRQVTGVSIMGWFKPLGTIADNPSPNTNTPLEGDDYNAFGLAGYLRGDSLVAGTDGHAARALLEVINGKVTGLGRRRDSQSGSASRPSTDDWFVVMPPGRWTHLAVSFDFDAGAIELYKNGQPLSSGATVSIGNWQLTGGVDRTSNTNSGGIKIAGSYPDNSQEFNPFNGRTDELMMFNRALTAAEVLAQFQLVSDLPGDYDRNGRVDGDDALAWQRTLGSTTELLADGNRNGTVDADDLAVWSDHYGATEPALATTTPVPEPASALLAFVAALPCRRRGQPV